MSVQPTDISPAMGQSIGGASIAQIEPEANKVARHKANLVKALNAVRDAAEAARLDGYYVEFGVNLDAFGRYTINPPAGLIKRF